MRPNQLFASDDPEVVRRLIREHPWGTLVSNTPAGLVASHYPILLDADAPELTVLTHVGQPDEQIHGLGESEMLLIVQGRHGYISPSWYSPDAPMPVPTWNFSVAHCYGVPQILDPDENFAVLKRLVAHFERHVEHPVVLERDWAEPIAARTVGIRLPITRFICKVKLSQNKDPATRRKVIGALRAPGPYSDPELAEEMERALLDDAGEATTSSSG
jgi:transcriptional regulator